MKSLLNKQDIHPVVFLSAFTNLKLNAGSGTLLDHVAAWINKPVREWKLLYKFTQDKQTSEDWHSKCDGKGPTVTVFYAKGGYIFGGDTHIFHGQVLLLMSRKNQKKVFYLL